METTIENAIRSVARDALTELVAVKEKYPISEHDKHFTEILDRHAKKSPLYRRKLSQQSSG
ncbi:hypothetical protein [Yersinia canariae]|uniref:hypothetical protein n=1 Tax=Yersinia canariae TaxID=2607663 RepID=UPI002168347A|nr:hypothetical protein [Yersinia canariae]